MYYYVGKPVVKAYASGRCGQIYVSWSTGSREMCRVIASVVVLSDYYTGRQLQAKKVIDSTFYNFLGLASGTLFKITVYVSRTENVTRRDPSDSTSARTNALQSTYVLHYS